MWERAEQRERVVSRRWRAAALAAASVAVAAVAAAGVFAFENGSVAGARVFDETRSCPVAIQGGVPVALLSAHSTITQRNSGQMFTMASYAAFTDHAGNTLGAVSSVAQGFGWAGQACVHARQIPLARAGLPLYGVFRPGERGLGSVDRGAACWVGSRVSVRIRAAIDSRERASSATLMLRSGKKLRPIAYIEWQPKRVAVYMSDDCHY